MESESISCGGVGMPNKGRPSARKSPRGSDRATTTKAGRTPTARADEGKGTTAPAQPKATKPLPDPGGRPPSAVGEPSPTASPRSLKELAGTLGFTMSPALL